MRLSTIWRISSPKFVVINRSRRLRLITANWGLDNSSYCAKTKFNNCFIIYLKNSKQTEAICILFVLRKKQFLVSPSAAVVVIISMASASRYDSRRHSNMAQTRPNFFHIDSLMSFFTECEKSIFGLPLSWWQFHSSLLANQKPEFF
jgi:hypothetical protein